jgi:hypothetical protein
MKVKNGGKINADFETENNPNLESGYEEIEDTKKLSLSLSYIDRFQEFIRKSELLEASASYYLYKFDSLNSQSKSFISKFTDVEPPDEDQIGRKFGSGKYLIVVAISPCEKAPEGAMRAYTIKIHSYYDTLKSNEHSFTQQSNPGTTIINPPANNMQDTLALINQIVGIITPLLQQKNASVPDYNQILFKNYETTAEVLKNNLMENIKLSGELQRKIINDGGNVEMAEVESQEVGLLEQFKPLIIEWLPKLIGDNAQAKAIQSLVQSSPQFKQVKNNTDELRLLINYLDCEKGKTVTDKILKNLKLSRV